MDLKVIAMAAAVVTGATAAEAAEQCAVSVDFSSFCCGIDRAAYDEAKAFVEASPLVAGHSERAYGMEGERVLCLTAKTAARRQGAPRRAAAAAGRQEGPRPGQGDDGRAEVIPPAGRRVA